MSVQKSNCHLKPIIIFDFDGTLANSLDPALDYLFNTVLPRHKVKLSPAKIKKLRNMSLGQIAFSLPFSFWKIPSIMLEVKKWHEANLALVHVYPEISKMLEILDRENFKLMILTSNSVENVSEILEKAQLKHFFIDIRESHGLFNKPQALRDIINHYGLTATDIIYVGDEIRDIRACHQAGIKIISVTYGLNGEAGLKKNKPQFLANSPLEVAKIAVNLCL